MTSPYNHTLLYMCSETSIIPTLDYLNTWLLDHFTSIFAYMYMHTLISTLDYPNSQLFKHFCLVPASLDIWSCTVYSYCGYHYIINWANIFKSTIKEVFSTHCIALGLQSPKPIICLREEGLFMCSWCSTLIWLNQSQNWLLVTKFGG